MSESDRRRADARAPRRCGAQSRAPACRGEGRVQRRRSDASLEAVARRAGVGIGTLYRHFPTREALFEAVYRREVDELAALAEALNASAEPSEALRRWVKANVEFVATKKGMAAALALAAHNKDLSAYSFERLSEAGGAAARSRPRRGRAAGGDHRRRNCCARCSALHRQRPAGVAATAHAADRRVPRRAARPGRRRARLTRPVPEGTAGERAVRQFLRVGRRPC